MNSKLKIVTLSKKKKKFWEILGWLTCFISLWFFYSNFWEREEYLTRKNLLKWLQNNNLPPKDPFILLGHSWKFDGYTLYLWTCSGYENDVSLHTENGCVLDSFISGVMDKRNNKKIQNILIAEVKGN